MKIKQFGFALLFTALFVNSISAQTPAPAATPKPASETPNELRDKAVALLKQTAKEAMTSSLPENRAAFSLQLAGLLWRFDEPAARGIYENAMADVRALLEQTRQTAIKSEAEDDEEFGGRSQYMTIQATKQLRSGLILELAKRDANAAQVFFRDTHEILFAPAPETTEENQLLKMLANDEEEAQLETRLAAALSEQDPERAFAAAQARLAKGITGQMTELVTKLYDKDPKRGAKLAGETVKKLRGEKLASDYTARVVAFELLARGSAILEETQKSEAAKKIPLLSEAELRDLAETLVKAGLTKDLQYEAYEYRQHLELLTKYAPLSAEQLKRKLEPPKEAAVAAATDTLTAEQIKAQEQSAKRFEERRKQTEQQQQEFQNLQTRAGAANEKVSLDEINRQLGKFKKREERLLALTQIAATLFERGDKETAKKLLDDARAKLVAEPKFYADLLAHLTVAHGYAAVDPPQSLEILENLVYRMNDAVGALVKIGEFAAGEEAIQNGEIRFGGFGQMFFGMIAAGGGEGGMFGGRLGNFEADIIRLAAADFDRLTAVANKFERPELRLLARTLILDSILKEKPALDTGTKTAKPQSEIEGVRH